MVTNQNEEEKGATTATGTAPVPGNATPQDTAGVEKAMQILEEHVTEKIGVASDGKP